MTRGCNCKKGKKQKAKAKGQERILTNVKRPLTGELGLPTKQSFVAAAIFFENKKIFV